MEDAHRVELSLCERFADITFIGVYDGHGGDAVAHHLADDARGLHTAIGALEHLSDEALVQSLMEYDQNIRSAVDCSGAGADAGSTCIFALIRPDGDGHQLTIGNVGDSRALLVHSDGSVDVLSQDHKPNSDVERARIERAGGSVLANRVDGQLAVSRAIGDWRLKGDWRCVCVTSATHTYTTSSCPKCKTTRPAPALSLHEQKVVAVPDIIRVEARYDDKLLLMCDGLVERMSNDEIAFVHAPSADAEQEAANQPLPAVD